MFSFFNIDCPESTFVQHMVNTHFIQGSCEHKSHSTLHYKQVFEFAHDSNNHVYGPDKVTHYPFSGVIGHG